MYSCNDNTYSFEDVDYELLKDETLPSEAKMSKNKLGASVMIIVIGILNSILPIMFDLDGELDIVFLACGALLVLCGIYFVIACINMKYTYDRYGFTRKSEIGKVRSYGYEDVKAAYFYSMINKKTGRVISQGLNLVMDNGKNINIETKLSGGERMIAQMLTKLDRSIVYNDHYCYKHDIKEL